MRKKRLLTQKREVVRSYWPYMLGLWEELFLDLGNLEVGPGGIADPKQCKKFRAKWSGAFHEWSETDDDLLLEVRAMVRNALTHDDPNEIQALAVRLANLAPLPASRNAHIGLHWTDTGRPDSLFPRRGPKGSLVPLVGLINGKVNRWEAPILFDMPRALAAAILSFTGKGLRLVCCHRCGRCTIGRSNQRFCPGGKCRRDWHRQQPSSKEKRREYMRVKMREYRAHEKQLNQFNQRLSGGKHAKAT